jgi:hypothetical protein
VPFRELRIDVDSHFTERHGVRSLQRHYRFCLSKSIRVSREARAARLN